MIPERKAAALFFLLLFQSALGATPTSYSVCLWNVENFGPADRFIDNKAVAGTMKPDAEIKSFTAILKQLHPDILGLCEIIQDPGDRYLKLAQSTLRSAGLDYPYTTTCRGEDSRIQNLLLSKYPIVRNDHRTSESFEAKTRDPLSGESSLQPLHLQRGIINSEIAITPDLHLRVLLVHLKSHRPMPGVSGEEKGESGEAYIRRQEALILHDTMTRLQQENPDGRLLAMGDFNDSPRSRSVTSIIGTKNAQPRFFDLWLKDWLGDWWTHFYRAEKAYERIDYMVVNEKLFHEWDGEHSFIYRQKPEDPAELNIYQPSDHRPLLATFRILDRPGK